MQFSPSWTSPRKKRQRYHRSLAYRPKLEQLENRRVPSFVAGRLFSNPGSGAPTVAVGDFNGDKIPDLAIADGFTNNVYIRLGNGDGTFQTEHHYATSDTPNGIAVGHFRGDGSPLDILDPVGTIG